MQPDPRPARRTTEIDRTGSPLAGGDGALEQPPTPVLAVEQLGVSFATPRGVVRAVDSVSFSLERGATLGIVGESGSGKSVLSRAIMGLLPPSATVAGSAWFDELDLANPDLDQSNVLGYRVAMVFQNPLTSLNPVRTIGAQVGDTLRRHLGQSRKEARNRAVELLKMVGIADPARRVGQYPHELSGGMRQRVAIAIALSCEPDVLIADEPTTALDATVQRQILELLSRLQAEHHMAMILITHDLGVVAGRTGRVAVMYAGRFVETSPTGSFFEEARHPYSAALLGAHPSPDAIGEALATVPGQPPDLMNLPPGCPFAPRCPSRIDRCQQDAPELVEVPDDRQFACHAPVSVASDLGVAGRARPSVQAGKADS